ncbi:MAG: MmcQ/YjbR family DNA-binding protein [Solirubrobacteraceae bacterium]
MHNRAFVWERPLRKADLRALGDAAPKGPILGARVEHLVAKEALLVDAPDIYFTTRHFDGYAAVLVRFERIPLDELRELVVEAWLTRAPKRLARDYSAAHLSGAEWRRSSPLTGRRGPCLWQTIHASEMTNPN